jgi:3-isopropylmalate/(R)-2-methylmalate dehydratase large subunit
LFVGLHLVHEVTTPQAFDMNAAARVDGRVPERTFATVDHIVDQFAEAALPRRDGGRDDGRLEATAATRASSSGPR